MDCDLGPIGESGSLSGMDFKRGYNNYRRQWPGIGTAKFDVLL
jgi:hypothetical protein